MRYSKRRIRLAERERIERSPVVFQTTVRRPCTPPFDNYIDHGFAPWMTVFLHDKPIKELPLEPLFRRVDTALRICQIVCCDIVNLYFAFTYSAIDVNWREQQGSNLRQHG